MLRNKGHVVQFRHVAPPPRTDRWRRPGGDYQSEAGWRTLAPDNEAAVVSLRVARRRAADAKKRGLIVRVLDPKGAVIA